MSSFQLLPVYHRLAIRLAVSFLRAHFTDDEEACPAITSGGACTVAQFLPQNRSCMPSKLDPVRAAQWQAFHLWYLRN